MTSDHKTNVNTVNFSTAHRLHRPREEVLGLVILVALTRKMERRLIHGCSCETFCPNSVRRETVWSSFYGQIISSKM